MPRKSLFLTLSFCVLCSVLVQAAPRDIIPAGTLLQCTLDEPNFSTTLICQEAINQISSNSFIPKIKNAGKIGVLFRSIR